MAVPGAAPSLARRARALAAGFALALGLSLPGVRADADSLQQLHEFLSATSSARGDFVQSGSKKGAATASTGHFEFSRPGRFRWVYMKPYEETIVSDGVKLYVYDPDLNQVTVKRVQGALPASPASILFGSNDLTHDFEVKADGASDGVEWLLAVPRSLDSSFSRIRIGFHEGLPAAMDLADTFGQVTHLQFSAVERNPSIEAARFRFEPPKGADVLEDQ
jgi:outer membrane lipoprotein carrier protein